MPPSRIAPGAPRLRYVDSLRGVAALLVVWLHVAQGYHGLGGAVPIGGQWLYRVAQDFDVGRVGVVVFFLISGFVVPSSLRPERAAPIGDFLIRRVFRIFPAYWLSIPFGAWAAYWLWQRPFGARDFAANLVLLQDLLGFRPAQGVYWTLSVEWLFYLLCIALFAGGSLRSPSRIGMLAASLLFLHTAGAVALWLGVPLGYSVRFAALHLALMLCGTLHRFCLLGDEARPSRAARLLMAALWLYLLVVLPLASSRVLGVAGNYAVSNAIGVLVFLAGTTFARVENRVGDALGTLSYAVYLFHLVVYLPLLWWLQQQAPGSWWRTQHLGTYLVACIGLTLAVALPVQRWIERPGIEAGRRLAAWWSRRTLAAPAAG